MNLHIDSKTKVYVSLVLTPFGLLGTEEPLDGISEERISAEIRGLRLLETIMQNVQAWTSFDCFAGNRYLVSSIEGFEIRIDVVKTISSFLINNDPHLEVHLYRGRNRTVGSVERLCIALTGSHPGCAMADAIVSLVLLGESNWPEEATPNTLREFAEAARRERLGKRLKLGLIELSLEDIEEISDIRKAIELGIPHAAIDMLCSFARRCYTCKGMEIEVVKRYIQPLFVGITPEDIEAYAFNPSIPTDLLFLPNLETSV